MNYRDEQFRQAQRAYDAQLPDWCQDDRPEDYDDYEGQEDES
jgi:hypothetical protein